MSAELITMTEFELQAALEKCDWLQAKCAEKLAAKDIPNPDFWLTMSEVTAEVRDIAARLLQCQEEDRLRLSP